jgi:NTE family protein
MVREGRLDTEHYKEILVHRVDGGAVLSSYGAVTRLSTDLTFYEALFKLGREAAQAWFVEHWSAVGERSTVDLRAVLRKGDKGRI